MITTDMTFKFTEESLSEIVGGGFVSEYFITENSEHAECLNKMALAYAERAIKKFLLETEMCFDVSDSGSVSALISNQYNLDVIHASMSKVCVYNHDNDNETALEFSEVGGECGEPRYKINYNKN